MKRANTTGRQLLLLWAILASLCAQPLLAGDEDSDTWPQYRGKYRDGISHSKDLLPSWPAEGPREVWRVAVGPGFSGISLSGDRLYTMFAADSTDFLVCYNAADARELWRYPLGEMFLEEFGNGPRSTPTVDETTVYALSARGVLCAVDKASGRALWKVSFGEKFDSETPQRGFAMSPLIDNGLVIIETGGLVQAEGEEKIFNTNIAAFDKKSGELRWQYNINPGRAGYCSPVAVDWQGNHRIVFLTSRKAIAFSDDGAVAWQAEALPGIVGMPVFIAPDKLFVSSSLDLGCKLLQIDASGDSVQVADVWANREMKNHFNSTLYHNGHLYGFSNATLKCLDAASGEMRWAKRGYGKGSVIATEQQLIILSDRGLLALAEASPEKFTEISRIQALNGKSWTAPTLVGGRLYLRNQSEMVCYDLRKP